MQPLLIKALASAWLATLAIAGPVTQVQTSSGAIIGHTAANRTGVTEFLGIRYAEAPVGELRFAPPKRYLAPAGTVYRAADWVSPSST
jgi:carboxylesterase type B